MNDAGAPLSKARVRTRRAIGSKEANQKQVTPIMANDRARRVQQIFEAALAKDGEDRASFLAKACGNDPALRAEVESLLEHDQQAAAGVMAPRDRARDDFLAPTQAAPSASGSTPHSAQKPEIEGYEVICELGHGGMGVVYQARDTRLDRMVAIKTILGEFQSEDRLELLRREARLAARLRHPNIVAVHALVDACDPPCIVMEWVDGVPLDAVARRLSLRDSVELVLKVARAAAYAHEMGVVHRDLKPGNILVDRTGEPRLLDFGLARAMLRRGEASSYAGIKGTPRFMAPEQFLSPAEVGPPADIYALGLVLYVMLTGTAPPVPDSPTDLSNWANREFPLPREVNADIPEPLQRICLKACELKEADRYPTADQMADDLQRYLDGRSVRARPTRYAQLLEDRVRSHVEALTHWEADNLITRREADSLGDRYMGLLRTESLWVPGARRLLPGAILIQVGGWLVVLSTILWATFYWNDLSSAQRILAIGFPTVIINGAALVLWTRLSQLVALIFTVLGTLLIPLFSLVLLSEFEIFATRAADDARYEFLPADSFSNRQLVAGFWISAVYAGWLLSQKRYMLLSAVLCLIVLLATVSTLLLMGLKDWLSHEWFATTAVAFGPVPIITYLAARGLDRPERDQLAVPFYAVAAVSFLGVIGGLAYDAPDTWFGLDPASDSEHVNPLNVTRELLFLGCGLVCFLLAWLHDRSDTRLRRLWGRLYFKLVPPCCVISADLLGDEPLWTLGMLGGTEARALELLVPVLCILLIIVGTRLQLRWFAYYGLLHLAVFIIRATHRHFEDYLEWPVIVTVTGAVAMIFGLWLEHKRLTAQRVGGG